MTVPRPWCVANTTPGAGVVHVTKDVGMDVPGQTGPGPRLPGRQLGSFSRPPFDRPFGRGPPAKAVASRLASVASTRQLIVDVTGNLNGEATTDYLLPTMAVVPSKRVRE